MCYQTSMTQRPADVPPIDEWTALLLGKVAVITGGGDGIGAAIATMFAQHGPPWRSPRSIDRGGGSIVNIHSVEGTRGFPGEPVYAAMKAGASHFTQSLAAGYGRKGIRCNGIGSDLIQTPQVDYLAGHDDHDERWESWAPVVASAGPTTWPASPCFSPVTCPPSSPATTSRSTAAPSPSPAGSTARKPGGSSTGPSSCRRPQLGLRRYSTAD